MELISEGSVGNNIVCKRVSRGGQERPDRQQNQKGPGLLYVVNVLRIAKTTVTT